MKENSFYCLTTVKITAFLSIVQLFLTKYELFELLIVNCEKATKFANNLSIGFDTIY